MLILRRINWGGRGAILEGLVEVKHAIPRERVSVVVRFASIGRWTHTKVGEEEQGDTDES